MFTTNTDRLRAELERRMVQGSIQPGDSIDESMIGHIYDVSRTPVREALLQLAAEGFIRIMPRSGIYVVQMSASELSELIELLVHNEAYCIALACERMAPATIKRMKHMQRVGEQAWRAADMAEFSRFVLAVHDMIYEGAANRPLKAQILQLRKRLVPYRSQAVLSQKEWLQSAWNAYRAIVSSLTDRNASVAQRHLADFVTTETRPILDKALMSPDHLYFKADVRSAEPKVGFDLETLFVLGMPIAPPANDREQLRPASSVRMTETVGMVPA